MAAVASYTSFKNSNFGGNLGKIHVFIRQVNRTVATLLTAWQNAATAFC